MPAGEPHADQAPAPVAHPPLPSAIGQARSEGYSNVEPAEAHKLIEEEKFAYVDVRTPEEYSQGHAPGSVNVPLLVKEGEELKANSNFLQEVRECFPDPDAPIVIACMHGRRGELAAQTLADAGFANLRNIKGGFHAWAADNLPSTAAP